MNRMRVYMSPPYRILNPAHVEGRAWEGGAEPGWDRRNTPWEMDIRRQQGATGTDIRHGLTETPGSRTLPGTDDFAHALFAFRENKRQATVDETNEK
jgi:hypothetical protein